MDTCRVSVFQCVNYFLLHYGDVIMGTMPSQITSITIVYSTVYSGADQGKYQSSASLAFVWGIHRGPVNSPHKWPVTRKMFPFDDVIMENHSWLYCVAPRIKGYRNNTVPRDDGMLSQRVLINKKTERILQWLIRDKNKFNAKFINTTGQPGR